MSRKPKRYNGLKRRSILRARGRILREAERVGHITNARAKQIGRFAQVWFHLKCMEVDGYLKHDGYNRWKPVKRPGPPRPYELGPRR
jgi:hypothetical protein